MKKLVFITLLFVCYGLYAQQQSALDKLGALTSGTWQMKTKKGFICERWISISKNELSGVGFSVNSTDTVIQERVKLIKNDAGIFYIPTVTNQNDGKEVRFQLSSSADNEFVFNNPTHDFPQRVVYKFIARDSLHAWVDGQHNGKFVKQDFYYSRVK